MGLTNQQTSLGTTLFGDMAFVGPELGGAETSIFPRAAAANITNITAWDAMDAVDRCGGFRVKIFPQLTVMRPNMSKIWKWIMDQPSHKWIHMD